MAKELSVTSQSVLEVLDGVENANCSIEFERAEEVRRHFNADTVVDREARAARAEERARGAKESARKEAEAAEVLKQAALPETTSESVEVLKGPSRKEIEAVFSGGPSKIAEAVKDGFFAVAKLDPEERDLVKQAEALLAEDDANWDVECYVGMPVMVRGILGLRQEMFGFVSRVLDPDRSANPPLLYVSVGAFHPAGKPAWFTRIRLMRPVEVLPKGKPYAVPWEKPDAV